MRNTLERLKRLENTLKSGDGVIVVDQVEGGYKLPNGEIVKKIEALRGQYSVIVIDDL